MAIAPVHWACGKRHWSTQECKLPDVEPRSWVKEFTGSRASAVPVVVDRRPIVKQVVVESFPAEDLDDEGENYVLRECEVCKMEFESRRRDARFCSAKCRKIASRVKAAADKEA